MKTYFTTLLLFGEATAVAVNLRHTIRQTQDCCFQLDSAGTVTEDVDEDHTGGLHLGGTFQDGGFCLNGGKIRDLMKNQCFIKEPKYDFQCYQQGAEGDTVFTIEEISDGKTRLVYDGSQSTYLACPTDNGDSYDIYSKSKPDTTGCLEVSLILSNQTGDCPASSSTSPTTDLYDPVSSDAPYPTGGVPSYPVSNDAPYPVEGADAASYPVKDSCARAVPKRAAEPVQ